MLLSKELEGRGEKVSVDLRPPPQCPFLAWPRLTRPRPAPRSRGRCTSAAASHAAGSTASGSCRCRTSGSNCRPLGKTRRGLLGRRPQEAGGRLGTKTRALTIKSHGSHRPLSALQRLQPLLRQLRAPRLWLRKSHCSGSLPRRLLSVSAEASALHTPRCNLNTDPCALLPVSHFRAERFGFLEIMLEIQLMKAASRFQVSFPTSWLPRHWVQLARGLRVLL